MTSPAYVRDRGSESSSPEPPESPMLPSTPAEVLSQVAPFHQLGTGVFWPTPPVDLFRVSPVENRGLSKSKTEVNMSSPGTRATSTTIPLSSSASLEMPRKRIQQQSDHDLDILASTSESLSSFIQEPEKKQRQDPQYSSPSGTRFSFTPSTSEIEVQKAMFTSPRSNGSGFQNVSMDASRLDKSQYTPQLRMSQDIAVVDLFSSSPQISIGAGGTVMNSSVNLNNVQEPNLHLLADSSLYPVDEEALLQPVPASSSQEMLLSRLSSLRVALQRSEFERAEYLGHIRDLQSEIGNLETVNQQLAASKADEQSIHALTSGDHSSTVQLELHNYKLICAEKDSEIKRLTSELKIHEVRQDSRVYAAEEECKRLRLERDEIKVLLTAAEREHMELGKFRLFVESQSADKCQELELALKREQERVQSLTEQLDLEVKTLDALKPQHADAITEATKLKQSLDHELEEKTILQQRFEKALQLMEHLEAEVQEVRQHERTLPEIMEEHNRQVDELRSLYFTRQTAAGTSSTPKMSAPTTLGTKPGEISVERQSFAQAAPVVQTVDLSGSVEVPQSLLLSAQDEISELSAVNQRLLEANEAYSKDIETAKRIFRDGLTNFQAASSQLLELCRVKLSSAELKMHPLLLGADKITKKLLQSRRDNDLYTLHLQEKNEQLRQMVDSLERKTKSLDADKKLMDQRVAELNLRVEELRTSEPTMSELQQQLETVRLDLTTATAERTKLQSELEETSRKYGRYSETIARLRSSCGLSTVAVPHDMGVPEFSGTALAELEEFVQHLTHCTSQLRIALGVESDDVDSIFSRAMETLERTRKLETSMDSMTTEFDKRGRTLQFMRTRVADLETAFQDAQKNEKVLQEQLKDTETRFKDRELSLEARLSDAAERIWSVSNEVEHYRKAKDSLTLELQKLKPPTVSAARSLKLEEESKLSDTTPLPPSHSAPGTSLPTMSSPTMDDVAPVVPPASETPRVHRGPSPLADVPPQSEPPIATRHSFLPTVTPASVSRSERAAEFLSTPALSETPRPSPSNVVYESQVESLRAIIAQQKRALASALSEVSKKEADIAKIKQDSEVESGSSMEGRLRSEIQLLAETCASLKLDLARKSKSIEDLRSALTARNVSSSMGETSLLDAPGASTVRVAISPSRPAVLHLHVEDDSHGLRSIVPFVSTHAPVGVESLTIWPPRRIGLKSSSKTSSNTVATTPKRSLVMQDILLRNRINLVGTSTKSSTPKPPASQRPH